MEKSVLDFLVVGAQKAGTTALWEFLRQHPQVALPDGKEAPFFNREEYYPLGFSTFLADYFSGVSASKRWGTVSPQYMSNDEVTRRVHAALPDARIIAILRHPVKRALSHYKMAIRRGHDTRALEEAFSAVLDPSVAARARDLPADAPSERECYLAWSEYGRILNLYRRLYGRDQILILFFEDLVRDAGALMDRILQFIGLEEGFRPPNLGEVVFAGATEYRLPGLKGLIKSAGGRLVWEFLPRRLRTRLSFAFERFNTQRGAPAGEGKSPKLPALLHERCLAHFAEDVALLERDFGVSVPWPEYSNKPATLAGVS